MQFPLASGARCTVPRATSRAVRALASPGASAGPARTSLQKPGLWGGRHQLLPLPQRPTFRDSSLLSVEGRGRAPCLEAGFLANILGLCGALGPRCRPGPQQQFSCVWGEGANTPRGSPRPLSSLQVPFLGGGVTSHLLTAKAHKLSCGTPGLLPR